MRQSKKIMNLNLEEQIDLLTKKVYLTNEDCYHKQGIIVSIKLNNAFYWVLLDFPHKTKNGKIIRRKFVNEKNIRLVD